MCGQFLSPGRVLQPSLGNVRRVLDQQVGFLSFGLVEGAEDVVGSFPASRRSAHPQLQPGEIWVSEMRLD
jgi:hypothetical protein